MSIVDLTNVWRENPHTADIRYLGGWMTSPTYRGCIVRESSGQWAVRPRDPWTDTDYTVTYAQTLEDARKALENVTPGGHKCEIFVDQWVGHCPERASVVVVQGDGTPLSRILLCRVHARHVFKGANRVSVEEWEATRGRLTSEGGPIVGERIAPPMAPVKRSDFLSEPVVWGDDWKGHVLGMTLTQDVRRGDLVMFQGTGAYEVQSIDVCPIPHSEDLWRFSCNGGTVYGTYYDRAVPVLYRPF
jgi:hypothetical protein